MNLADLLTDDQLDALSHEPQSTIRGSALRMLSKEQRECYEREVTALNDDQRCQSCGTDRVSLEASQASARLQTLPEAARAVLVENFGEVPTVLCAACFLPAYGHALQVGMRS